jgi:hypothetical protein
MDSEDPSSCPSLHAVGLVVVCWVIWRTRNVVCFEDKRVKSPTKIICLTCVFLSYSAGLLKEDPKEQMIQGAEVMKTATLFFHSQDLQAHSQGERQLMPFVG